MARSAKYAAATEARVWTLSGGDEGLPRPCECNFHITFKVPSLPYEATSHLGEKILSIKGHQILYEVVVETGIEI